MRLSFRLLLAVLATLMLLVWTWTTPHQAWHLVMVSISFIGFSLLLLFDIALRRR